MSRYYEREEPKYSSVDEVEKHRKELAKEYDGKLPDYLHDYFDDEREKVLREEFYREVEKNRQKFRDLSLDEKIEFKRQRDEKFWSENKLALVKKRKRHSNPVYPEPPKAVERVEQERELTPEELLALKKLCENNLYLFAVRYFPHYLSKPSSKLHRFLYNTLTRDINRAHKKKTLGPLKLAIAAPRDSAKTTIVGCILPVWCVCYKKKHYIGIISSSSSTAEERLYDIKTELEHNEKLKRDFPEACGKGPIWRNNEIITRNNVKIGAYGTGSQIRGRKFGTHRFGLVVNDDIEEVEMIRSEALRQSIYKWFNQDLIHAGSDDCDYIMIGTILGREALLYKLIETDEYPDWHGIKFKALEKFPNNMELWDEWYKILTDRFNPNAKDDAWQFYQEHRAEMDEGAELLWPEGDPLYNLMIEYYSRPTSFYHEKQNEALDPSQTLVSMDNIHFENFSTNPEIKKILKNCVYYGALDPSLGKKSTSDYSCIVTLARDIKSGYIYVVDIDMKRRSVDDQIYAILAHHEKYRYRAFAIETNAFQVVVADILRKKSRETGIYVPVKEVKAVTDKRMRFESVVPFIYDGTIVFDKHKMNTKKMYNEAVYQMIYFTGVGDEKDDFVDALGYAFQIAKGSGFKLLTRPAKRN